MFMGVSSYTGLREMKELQILTLVDVEGELTASSSTFSAPHKTVSLPRYQHWEDYKHNINTVFIDYS